MPVCSKSSAKVPESGVLADMAFQKQKTQELSYSLINGMPTVLGWLNIAKLHERNLYDNCDYGLTICQAAMCLRRISAPKIKA